MNWLRLWCRTALVFMAIFATDFAQAQSPYLCEAEVLRRRGVLMVSDWDVCRSADAAKFISAVPGNVIKACGCVIEANKQRRGSSSPEVHWHRAIAYERRAEKAVGDPRVRDLREALGDWNAAIPLQPANAQNYYGYRGHVHDLLGEFDAAVTDQERAIALDRAGALHYYNLAVSLYHRNRPSAGPGGQSDAQRALNAANEAVRLGLAGPAALWVRGQVYERLGDIENARRDYRAAVAAVPAGDWDRSLQYMAQGRLAVLSGATYWINPGNWPGLAPALFSKAFWKEVAEYGQIADGLLKGLGVLAAVFGVSFFGGVLIR